MWNILYRLFISRSMLLFLVDTNDRADIERHISRLELIRENIPSARKTSFAWLGKDLKPTLRLKTSAGEVETLTRSAKPKLFKVLDYLHEHPKAKHLSLRRLGMAIALSKSSADKAKRYWQIPENQEAFAEFRAQEEAKTPF